MITFMAECFWPGVTRRMLENAGRRGHRAAQAASSEGGSSRYLGSILVPSDEIAFCLFEATSLETATELSQQASIPFERILEVVRLDAAMNTTVPQPKENT